MVELKAFVNGRIYVSFRPLKIVDGLLIAGGRVLYAGDMAKVAEVARRLGGEVVDLRGKTVMPSFFDSHIHLDELGLSLEMLDLRGVRDIETLKRKLLKYASGHKTSWVLGYGWDQEELGRYPTREDLDVVKNRPVLLYRRCFHVAVANSRALELLDLKPSEDFDPETGIIRENALDEARKKVEETLTVWDYARFIEKAQEHLLSLGVTAVAFVSVGEKALRALLWLDRKERLLLRVFAYVNPDVLPKLDALGIGPFGGDMLRIAGVKVLADGSLGARTAWLSEPYADEPTRGHPNLNRKELKEIVEAAKALDLDVAIHAIGDATLDMILDVFGEANVKGRVEHASLVRDDQLDEMASLDIRAAVQPRFVISDWWAVRRLGPRARFLYRFRSMREKGIEVGFGTDSPIEPANPWEGVYAAVTRGRFEGIETFHYTAQEVLSIREALDAYTRCSALVTLAPDIGRLEPGCRADFIVLDKDPLAISESELREVEVLETYVAGHMVRSSLLR
ncbi:amidohydrolase [Pyrococcus yayanosii]|uniref:Predicted metal-dependent hydrolase with the TIM-barrel fold n=1 Tax=Pyrococcus yayanosii (strain CH1 / JCM 16557) TaxID=529709 RepID=F8AIA1_PYRYC|nr:amidohydrolase [Pyrococcus yayanosii]AEH24338.1 Predicted metal-dependent hydrolase with the TIM-barrel fold [Pyrococcus yayanosii CH1]